MSIVNLGTQTINWKYKTSLKGSNLSRMFNGCISPGIYLNNGSYIQANTGLITSYAGNQITINAFEAVFKASSTQTVHIGTSTAIALSTDGGLGYITESYPYITMSYSWADQIINYIDFAFKASGSITAYDLIIGKAIFTGGVVTSIDYSEASYPPYYNPTTQEYNVFGGIKLDGNRIDEELTTDIDVNTTFSEFDSDADIYFAPTADRTADITAGAERQGTVISMYNSGTFNTTITYYSTNTFVLYPNGFVKFKWIGTRFILIESSKEKKDIITEINTNYAPTIFERNAELRFTPTADRTINLTANARFYGCEVLIANDATATYKLVVSFGGVETIDIHYGCEVRFVYTVNGWTYEVLTDYSRETETIINGTFAGYQKYRKVINFGALPNAAIKLVAHGLTGSFFILNRYLVAENPSITTGRRTFVVNAPFDKFQDFYTDNTNVQYSTITNDTGYTKSYAIIEYIKATL